jgi:hypothetical protein
MFIKGENNGVLGLIFRTLNEYFRKHIGFWAEVSGTTDANGRCVFTISPGFEPSTVLIAEFFVDGSAHDMGPLHIHSHSATTLDVHFLTKAGQDRATHAVKISYLCLPFTS